MNEIPQKKDPAHSEEANAVEVKTMLFPVSGGMLKINTYSDANNLYGCISFGKDQPILEGWICLTGEEFGRMDVRSSEHGVLGFSFNPMAGTSFDPYSEMDTVGLVNSKVFQAVYQAYRIIEVKPETWIEDLFEGIFISLVAQAPLCVNTGHEWGAGALQSLLFNPYHRSDMFLNCVMVPRVSTFFESWFFFDEIRELEKQRRSHIGAPSTRTDISVVLLK